LLARIAALAIGPAQQRRRAIGVEVASLLVRALADALPAARRDAALVVSAIHIRVTRRATQAKRAQLIGTTRRASALATGFGWRRFTAAASEQQRNHDPEHQPSIDALHATKLPRRAARPHARHAFHRGNTGDVARSLHPHSYDFVNARAADV
jgi:hypothetical protein